MPNYCNYEMKIVGKKENVDKLISYLQSDYSYTKVGDVEMPFSKEKKEQFKLQKCSADKHFFRVFEADHDPEYDDTRDNGDHVSIVSGYCAWSIISCMINQGKGTYYNDWKDRLCDDFRGTHMEQATKDLDLVVEIFSEECGCGFMEHFIIDKGKITKSRCEDYSELYDEDGEPILDENGDQMTEGGFEWEYTI